jgi:hypothetical protein
MGRGLSSQERSNGKQRLHLQNSERTFHTEEVDGAANQEPSCSRQSGLDMWNMFVIPATWEE